MGLYPIDCYVCHKPFLWFSGNPSEQRCGDCIKKAGEQTDILLDHVDKIVNQTPLACGHKPCLLPMCLGCDHHCPGGKHD